MEILLDDRFVRRPDAPRPLFSDTERRVLDALRRRGALSRADLARETGLAKPSVSHIVDDLMSVGLVASGEMKTQGRGKPGLTMGLRPDAALCVGLSLMTDAFVVSLMDLAGRVRDREREPFSGLTRDAVMDRIQDRVEAMIARHAVERRAVFGVGLGVTGFFVDGSPRVNPPSPLDDFALIDLKVLFEQKLGLPVSVENDGSAAAVGEMLNGVGAWTSNFAYLYFSAGFGGGVILDGQLWRGVNGNAGEFGGILSSRQFQPNLETLRAEVARSGPSFASLGQFLDAFDPAWPGVEAWLQAAGDSLTSVYAAILSTLDVEALVLGGRMPPSLVPLLIERIDQTQAPRRGHVRPQPRLVACESPGDATSAGAAALVFRNTFF